MKICSLNSYNPFLPVQKNSPDKKQTSKNKISGEKVLNYLNCNGVYNISFGNSQSVAVYAIDIETNKWTKFPGQNKAAKAIGVPCSTTVGNCLKGKKNNAKGHFFVRADEVETIDKDGKFVLNEEKMNEKIRILKSEYENEKNEKAVYVINSETGEYSRFSGQNDAAKALGIKRLAAVRDCLNGKRNNIEGHFFVRAGEVETIDKDGKFVLDEEKMKQKTKTLQSKSDIQKNKTPIYATDKNGNNKRYDSIIEASKDLGIKYPYIQSCLAKQQYTTGGYAFVYADDAEHTTTDGKIIVNTGISPEHFDKNSQNEIYSIDKTGKIQHYENVSTAAKELDINPRNIYTCLKEKEYTMNGYAFVKADDILLPNKENKIIFNGKVLDEKFQNLIKNAVYIIDPKGNYSRYDSEEEAAKALGVKNTAVSMCVIGINSSVNKHLAIKAKYVESLKSGKREINTKMLEQYGEEAIELERSRHVIALRKEDNFRKEYSSIKEASEALGIPKNCISNCISGLQKTSHGYRFKRLPKHSPDNNTKKDTVIYSIFNGVDIKEFKNIDEAAEKLNLEVEDIQFLLKRGKTKDGKANLNGYVFATSDDE